MDILTKNRIIPWTIGILVLLNLASLTMLWLGYQGGPGLQPPPPGQETAARFLREQLSLSEQQYREYLQLRDSHFKETIPLTREMESLRRNLMNELFKESPDLEAAAHYSEAIGRTQARLEDLTFNHFLDLKRICGADQAEELHLILREAQRSFRRRPPAVQAGSPE